jgi:hypothetical protein
MPICTVSATRLSMKASPDPPPAPEQQMSRLIQFVKRTLDRLIEALERQYAHDRDRYVEQSLNAREVSQRVHRLEHETGGLQA